MSDPHPVPLLPRPWPAQDALVMLVQALARQAARSAWERAVASHPTVTDEAANGR